MAYHRVWSSIWTEPWSEDARYLALYLLTCEHRATEGLYRLPKAYVMADLGWPGSRLSVAWNELVEDGFVEYDAAAQVVLIPKALSRQQPANPNAVKAAVKAVEGLPQTVLLQRLYGLAERFSERFAEGLRERFPEEVLKPLPQEWTDPPAPTPAPTPRSSTKTETLRAAVNLVPVGKEGVA